MLGMSLYSDRFCALQKHETAAYREHRSQQNVTNEVSLLTAVSIMATIN